jgi:hypothetical protein
MVVQYLVFLNLLITDAACYFKQVMKHTSLGTTINQILEKNQQQQDVAI